MMRTVASAPARILDVLGDFDPKQPNAFRTVQVEQSGPNKGPFKLELNSKDCCGLVKGGEAILELKQKVQDGQAHA